MYICAKIRDYDDRNTLLLDTWKSFSDLVSTGKVKKVGISNYFPQRMAELAHIILEYSLAPIDFVQLKYSVIDPVKDADFGKLVILNPEMR
jgi:aryl-alcohol dehydrogenase-like predicted oxidoreductase